MKCQRRTRCLLDDTHTGRHWFGSPQRAPALVDDMAAVRDLRDIARRERVRLERELARLHEVSR